MSAIKPLGDRVVVKRADREETTQSGIVIPDTAKEKPDQGHVVAVGPGKKLESGTVMPMNLEAGDRVIFGKYAGTEVKIDGETLIIMREDDVLGVVADA